MSCESSFAFVPRLSEHCPLGPEWLCEIERPECAHDACSGRSQRRGMPGSGEGARQTLRERSRAGRGEGQGMGEIGKGTTPGPARARARCQRRRARAPTTTEQHNGTTGGRKRDDPHNA